MLARRPRSALIASSLPTSRRLRLRSMPDERPPGAEWRIREIAQTLGVAESTVRAYRARPGRLPPADGEDRYGPWWYPETIVTWAANRPGSGNRSERRGHRPRKTVPPEN